MTEENTPLVEEPTEEPTAGDVLSMESKVMIQLYREQNDILQSHMARQNMLLDKVIMQVGISNAALELMLGPGQKAIHEVSVSKIVAAHQDKVRKLMEKIAPQEDQTA